ncbi:hypothetical protein [Streptomyces sp. NPDC002825]|uniref:hypothetical protein n=1 Tax=Streptomyces sp. NPDC002825 TaxID=3154666 RepID=UPI00332F91FB
MREDFGLETVSLLEEETEHPAEPRWRVVVAAAGEDPPARPYDADVESPAADGLTLAARGRKPSGDDRLVLGACAAQPVMAHVHARLAATAAETGLSPRPNTRASVLLAASRDLRAPLRTAEAALDHLFADLGTRPSAPETELPDVIADAAVLTRVLAVPAAEALGHPRLSRDRTRPLALPNRHFQ